MALASGQCMPSSFFRGTDPDSAELRVNEAWTSAAGCPTAVDVVLTTQTSQYRHDLRNPALCRVSASCSAFWQHSVPKVRLAVVHNLTLNSANSCGRFRDACKRVTSCDGLCRGTTCPEGAAKQTVLKYCVCSAPLCSVGASSTKGMVMYTPSSSADMGSPSGFRAQAGFSRLRDLRNVLPLRMLA